MTPINGISIYEVSESEWWTGPSLEVTVEAYIADRGCWPEEVAEIRQFARELSDAEANALQYKPTVDGIPHSFRVELENDIKMGRPSPCFFAATEY